MYGGLAVGQHGLHQLVLGRKQGLLRLQNGEQVGCALAILKLRDLEGLARRLNLARQVILRLAGVGDLYQRIIYIGISVECGTLVGGNEFLLRRLGEILLPRQLASVEDRLQQARAITVAEIGSLQQRADCCAEKATRSRQRYLRQERCSRSINDLKKNAPADRIRIVSKAVYRAMVEIANVPRHDRFQVVTRHEADEIIYPEEGYLGIEYSRDIIMIQVTWVGGRSTEVKKKFFQQIADEIHEEAQVRKQDIWISLVDSGQEDWSFGNGEMQYAPK
jgi:4-oxalocrotonate tautomerase